MATRMINTRLEHVPIKTEIEDLEKVDNEVHHIKEENVIGNYATAVEVRVEQKQQDEENISKIKLEIVCSEPELEVLRTEQMHNEPLMQKRPRRSARGKQAETIQTETTPSSKPQTKFTNKRTEELKSFERNSPLDTNSSDSERRFTCDQCSRTFNNHTSLVEHKYLHSGEKPFACNECGKQFRTKQDFKMHMRHHTNDRRYKCTMCPKAFVRSFDLKTHMHVHTGEKPYICDICNKSFRANQNLIVHKKSHMGEASKIYKCEYCEKKFMRNIDRKIHMRSHTGEKPFKCQLCERSFSSNVNVKAHVERDHTTTGQRMRRKPGPKPKNWKEEVAKQNKLIEELRQQLKQQMKTETANIVSRENSAKALTTKEVMAEPQVSMNVSMEMESKTKKEQRPRSVKKESQARS